MTEAQDIEACHCAVRVLLTSHDGGLFQREYDATRIVAMKVYKGEGVVEASTRFSRDHN